MFIERHLQQACELIKAYDGKLPLHYYLKQFFSQHKKFGSRDRKAIQDLLYGYYRLGKIEGLTDEERCRIGAYLSGTAIYKQLNADWPEHGRMQFIIQQYPAFKLHNLVDVDFEYSEGIEHDFFCQSFLSQPKTFIRIRKNLHKIEAQLKEAGIAYEMPEDNCLSFSHKINLEQTLKNTSDYVVQDYASQKCAALLQAKQNEFWWDACAASGGKSLALLDNSPSINLYVSDLRSSILHNLDARFKLYRQRYQKKSVINLEQAHQIIFDDIDAAFFDHIIIDAPCSGSGTWARTPEQLYFSAPDFAKVFQAKQVNIVLNCLPFLKKGGSFYYITCSACKTENEDVIALVKSKIAKLEIISQQVINGLAHGSDIMFIAECKLL